MGFSTFAQRVNAATEAPFVKRQGPTTKSLGDAAEAFVADYLQRKGYLILGRNLRFGRFELDIVAQSGTVIVIVEVRRRDASSFTHGFSSVDWKKRQRVRRAGERLWNRWFKNDPQVERLRFDVASVTFTPTGPEVEYARAAF